MIYLIDAVPLFCPHCAGEPLATTSRYAFYSGTLQECQCGAKFQYIPYPQIIQLADSAIKLRKSE